jgi:hypothetical protein
VTADTTSYLVNANGCEPGSQVQMAQASVASCSLWNFHSG